MPFVVLRDIYPFFRFGMFATPVQQAHYTERYDFYVKVAELHDWQLVPVQVLYLDESFFHYLMRRELAAGRADSLLQHLLKVYAKRRLPAISQAILLQWRLMPNGSLDSIVVAYADKELYK